MMVDDDASDGNDSLRLLELRGGVSCVYYIGPNELCDLPIATPKGLNCCHLPWRLSFEYVKPFREIAEELKPDGALRDFYIVGTDMGTWQLFLESVRHLTGPNDFRVDGEIALLPSRATEIFAIRSTASPCLSIHVGSGIVCCHFFTETEIELDFAPEDYATEDEWKELNEFFTTLCAKLKRNGIVCHENAQDQIIEIFSGE